MLSFSFVATPHERVICSLQFLHFHSVPGCVLPTPGFPIGIVWWSPYSVLNLFEFSSWAACPCLSWDASFNSLQAFCWPCIAPLSAPSPLCWLIFTHWPLCWMLDSIPPPYPLLCLLTPGSRTPVQFPHLSFSFLLAGSTPLNMLLIPSLSHLEFKSLWHFILLEMTPLSSQAPGLTLWSRAWILSCNSELSYGLSTFCGQALPRHPLPPTSSQLLHPWIFTVISIHAFCLFLLISGWFRCIPPLTILFQLLSGDLYFIL